MWPARRCGLTPDHCCSMPGCVHAFTPTAGPDPVSCGRGATLMLSVAQHYCCIVTCACCCRSRSSTWSRVLSSRIALANVLRAASCTSLAGRSMAPSGRHAGRARQARSRRALALGALATLALQDAGLYLERAHAAKSARYRRNRYSLQRQGSRKRLLAVGTAETRDTAQTQSEAVTRPCVAPLAITPQIPTSQSAIPSSPHARCAR